MIFQAKRQNVEKPKEKEGGRVERVKGIESATGLPPVFAKTGANRHVSGR